MRADRAIEYGMAAVAESAATPSRPSTRATEILEALELLVPYECAALSQWDSVAGRYRPLANVAYPTEILTALHMPSYWHETKQLGMLDHRRALRFRDLPCRGASVQTIVDFAGPAGFREGLGFALFTSDDRHVGRLSLNTSTRRYPTDHQRDAIELLGRTLGNAIDAQGPLSVRFPTGPAVVLGPSGPPEPLPASPPSPLLGRDTRCIAAVRSLLLAEAATSAFLWPTSSRGDWRKVVITRCEEGDLPAGHVVVSVEPAPSTYGLTDRELEVLTFVARGDTNNEIAGHLVISPRTVSTHVEHILGKLGAATRAQAAVRAAAEGLLVWVDDAPPVA